MTSEAERLPTELRLLHGAMALDGGSLSLHAVDQDEARVELFLDWAIQSQREGTTQFYANDRLVPRGSPEEARWLSLLRGAVPEPRNARPASEDGSSFSPGVILADDAAAYWNAIEQGPASALAHLATRFVTLISSPAYQEGRTPVPPQAPQNRVRSLVTEGKRMEAIKAYRDAHPDIGIVAASSAVKALGAEMEQAMRRSKIVTRIPIEELWTDDGALPATRLRTLDRVAIRDLLRRGPVRFVVADVGHDLRWIPPAERFDFWKRDGELHLAMTVEVHLDDLPDGMAYLASEWTVAGDEAPILLLEVYH
ncbi:hypothetical protein [Polyangium mundeleinium]|uniref:Uncharacterized protein n=1 Tax=Polyangium mundeleinium TaxID=2995306 RepID=A0ABT5F5Q2_9BACT|nr:hypothetical protein [Polyangium mundeleinium]MDC0749281.1 hypothetical protein [Polyangium mundeleinium]